MLRIQILVSWVSELWIFFFYLTPFVSYYPIFTCVDPDPQNTWMRIKFGSGSTKLVRSKPKWRSLHAPSVALGLSILAASAIAVSFQIRNLLPVRYLAVPIRYRFCTGTVPYWLCRWLKKVLVKNGSGNEGYKNLLYFFGRRNQCCEPNDLFPAPPFFYLFQLRLQLQPYFFTPVYL